MGLPIRFLRQVQVGDRRLYFPYGSHRRDAQVWTPRKSSNGACRDLVAADESEDRIVLSSDWFPEGVQLCGRVVNFSFTAADDGELSTQQTAAA